MKAPSEPLRAPHSRANYSSLANPVGRIDVDVTHVGRKRRHMRAATASIRRTALQRANRKRVPQIVETRAAPRRRCDTCPVDQPATEAWCLEKKPTGETLNIVRKIAGIAVNCLEQYGAPYRTATPDWLPGASPRFQVFCAIDTERAYQNARWEMDDVPHTVGEEVWLLADYEDEPRHIWRIEQKPEIGTLHIIRKIAAIAVRCMENHGPDAPGG